MSPMVVVGEHGAEARQTDAAGETAAEPSAPTGYIVGRCDATVWGLSPAERLRRSGARAGIAEWREDGAPLPQRGRVVLFRADYVVEDRLVRALAANPGVVLVADKSAGAGRRMERAVVAAHVPVWDAGEVAALLRRGVLDSTQRSPAGLAVLGPAELGSAYDQVLRKRAAPFVASVADEPVRAIEDMIFRGAYKGVTDFVTKYLWPRPARWVTRRCVRYGVSANAVTAASLVLVFVALALFGTGRFAAGLAVAWLMTFLDTVDGKLARVTLSSTPAGNVFDHGIDLVHPPFWYAAWWYGLWAPAGMGAGVPAAHLDAALWIILIGYLLGRAMEGLFIWLFRIEIHTWRPVDSFFRLITARRNPNLVLLTVGAAVGRPDLGFLAIAVWTVASLLFHGVRIVQALQRRRTGAVRSWLAEIPSPAVAP